MSFFDDASLAFLPSGAAGKDGKAYSIKPTDGTGDFTFSRGSNLAATRVGADGLIEKGRENLLLQSNNFDTTWFNVRSTETGGQTDKDGGSTAWLLESTDPSTSYIQQNVSSSGVQTFSVIAKKGTTDYIYLLVFGSNLAGQYFDLNNGTLAAPVYTTIDASIEDLGGGWYRCSLFFQSNVTHVTIYPADNGTSSLSAVGSNIYIQDAQLEIGLAATDYIETGATTGKAGLLEDEPRFDYSGGATCPSLLLEPSRTQLIPNSEYYDPTNTEWRSEGNNGVTITTNDTISPEGLSNASKLQGGGASNDRLQYNFSTSNTKAIYSVFVKGTGDVVRFSIFNSRSGDRINYDVDANGNFTLNQATGITNHDIEDYGNGWYRIWGEFTTDAALTNYFQIYSDINGSGPIYLYGVQLEDNATYPTSYIPNHSGGSVTRGADQPLGLTTAGTDGLINNYTTTIYIELDKIINAGLTRFVTLFSTGGGSNPRVLIYSSGVNFIVQYRVTGEADQYITKYSFVADATNKLLVKINGTDLSMFHNGTKVGNITIVQGDDLAYLSLAESAATDAGYFLSKLLSFPEALPDEDCIALTTL